MRCPDCKLAHKRWMTRRSLREKRRQEASTLDRIQKAARPAQTGEAVTSTKNLYQDVRAQLKARKRMTADELRDAFPGKWDSLRSLLSRLARDEEITISGPKRGRVYAWVEQVSVWSGGEGLSSVGEQARQ